MAGGEIIMICIWLFFLVVCMCDTSCWHLLIEIFRFKARAAYFFLLFLVSN